LTFFLLNKPWSYHHPGFQSPAGCEHNSVSQPKPTFATVFFFRLGKSKNNRPTFLLSGTFPAFMRMGIRSLGLLLIDKILRENHLGCCYNNLVNNGKLWETIPTSTGFFTPNFIKPSNFVWIPQVCFPPVDS